MMAGCIEWKVRPVGEHAEIRFKCHVSEGLVDMQLRSLSPQTGRRFQPLTATALSSKELDALCEAIHEASALVSSSDG